jgi:hypothetical protein
MTEKDINIVEIAPIIPNELFKLINVELNKILEKICEDNKLNSKMILEKYSNDISKIGSKFGVKKRNRRVLPFEFQCMGRKLDGEQCTRGKRENSDYCKSHENKLPYGRIDEPFKFKESKVRGRKKKDKLNDFVATHVEIIDGHNRLVDNNNFVYTFDINKPEFLGILVNGIINKIEC